MSTANVTESVLEVELVEQWRLDTLERAGYDAESAAVLAASPEVDLHRGRLARQGRLPGRARPPDPALAREAGIRCRGFLPLIPAFGGAHP